MVLQVVVFYIFFQFGLQILLASIGSYYEKLKISYIIYNQVMCCLYGFYYTFTVSQAAAIHKRIYIFYVEVCTYYKFIGPRNRIEPLNIHSIRYFVNGFVLYAGLLQYASNLFAKRQVPSYFCCVFSA